MNRKVLAAMSGGVDSSVAALLLRNKGYDVAGVTMRFGTGDGIGTGKCCGPTTVEDAKRVCDHIRIPHFVLDYADELEKKVIARFVGEYGKGRTPNPCVDCNRHLKFGSLLRKARAMGFDYFSTGHYASVGRRGEEYCLKRPKDRKKDQTYFLYPIPYGELKSILFPLAALTKEEVRLIAKEASLPVAEKQESQDICFITERNYHAFLLERGQTLKPGPIVDIRNNILGTHRGIAFYTIGQRGGLGISHRTPLYVISIDVAGNRIVVGEKERLRAKGLIAGNLNLLTEFWPERIYAKIRYRKKESLCKVTFEDDRVEVTFFENQESITPGQSVVFYADDCVLGGGEIEEVLSSMTY
jgi:tRNA-specific 2-thiouridylase